MNQHFNGLFHEKGSGKWLTVAVELVHFEDEGIYYCYAPSLELMGYGHSQQEARESWEIILEEYISYVLDKKTLAQDLLNRGWTVSNQNQFLQPPSLTYMLQHSHQLQDVYNKHDFSKTSESVELPALA